MEIFWLGKVSNKSVIVTASMRILHYAWDSDQIQKKCMNKKLIFSFFSFGVRHIKNYGPWKEPINQ